MCRAKLPVHEFVQEQLLQVIQNNRKRDAVCKKHTRSKQALLKSISGTCAMCGEAAKTKFDAVLLRMHDAAGTLDQAVCLACNPEHSHKLKGKQFRFIVCSQDKTMSHFTVEMQKIAFKKDWKRLRCHECQYPKCSKCGDRPTAPPHAKHAPRSKADVDSFKSLTCLYPPCSKCGSQITKREKEVHGGKNSWLCAMCQSKHWLKISHA